MSSIILTSKYSRRSTSENVAKDDLECEQSPAEERRRSSVEGKDARLTELAAPKVVPEHETGDDLENEETVARKSRGSEGDDALAEVAAPEPVEHEDSNEDQNHQRPHGSSAEKINEEEKQSHETVSTEELSVWVEITTVAWLIFFSFLGTLARLGVEAISTYPNAILPSTVVWANMGGSFFLGFLVEDRRLFRYLTRPHLLTDDKDETHRNIDSSKKILPLYIGLVTGFCGSFTSFSTFITDAFLALSNDLPLADPDSPYHTVSANLIRPRNGGYSFMAVLAILIIHPAISVSALKTGAHLAAGLEKVTPSLPERFISRILDPLALVLAPACWVGAILLTIWPIEADWRGRATIALVFAPPGVLLRFYASRYLNARIAAFPLGTFAVNIFGTCIEGMCYDLQHSRSIVGRLASTNSNACAVLDGIMQGFCGCTTTVSTWVVELNSLRRRHAWFYGLSSVGVALGFQVAIMGSVAWTSGFDQACE